MKRKFYSLENCSSLLNLVKTMVVETIPHQFLHPSIRLRRKPAFLLLYNKVIICSFCILLFANKAVADYTINAGVSTDPASTPALLNATGTISIYGTMAINTDVTFTSATPLAIIIYGAAGQIYWYSNKTLIFPAGTTITFINTPSQTPGLQPISGNAAQVLQIGTVKYAASNDNSNNVIYSFAEMNNIGGTARVNPSTSTPAVCLGASINFSANQVTPPGDVIKVKWIISPVSGTFTPNNTSASTSTSLSGLAANTYTVTCELYSDAGGGNYFLAATKSTTLTVNPLPTAAINGTTSVCQHSTSPVITFTGANGTAPYTFTYKTGAGANQTITTISGNSVTVAAPTSTAGSFVYTLVSVKDASSSACLQSETGTAIVTVDAQTAITTQSATSSFCLGSDAAISVIASGASPVYQWQESTTGINGTYINLSNSDTYAGVSASVLNVTNPTVSMSSNFYRVLVTGSCGVVTSNATALKFSNLWMGTNSNNWNDAGNWSDGTLPSTTCPAVYIPNRINQPTLNSLPDAVINNLVIDAGALLTVTNANLKIAGSISNGGTLQAGNGTLEFNGTAAQSIAGNLFAGNTLKNLTVSNSVSLTVDNATGNSLKITGDLAFGNVNNSTLNTGDNIILVSTATATARVADITNSGINAGNKFNGKVTVERYFPSRRAWRLFTAPVAKGGSIFDNWQNGGAYIPGKGTFITGSGATNPTGENGLDWSVLNNVSTKYGSALSPVLNTKANGISKNIADAADNIPYFIFVRGDRNPANTDPSKSNTTTLSSMGQLQTGTQTFSVSSAANGFTMVGNPYASPVDMKNIVRNNVASRFYVWDPYLNAGTGGYIMFEDFYNTGTYTPNLATTMSPAIQSGQAFFVLTASAGPASVVFQETAKSSNSNLVSFRAVSKGISFQANLYSLNEGNKTELLDGTQAQFDNSFNKSVDIQDALKAANLKENISLQRDELALTIERRPVPAADDTLFLQLTRTTTRSYRFEFIPTNMNPALSAFLEDGFTGKSTPINMVANNVYDFAITADPKSATADRFRIVFKQTAPLPVTFKTIKAAENAPGIAVDWNVENEINISRYEVERSADGVNFSKTNSIATTGKNGSSNTYSWVDTKPLNGNNFYRVRSIGTEGKFGVSSVVLVKMGKMATAIRIYPNPVTDGIIGAEFKNIVAGVYNVRLLNGTGQTILNKAINLASGTSMEKIQAGNNLVPGIYQLEVRSPNKEITSVRVFIK